MSRLQSKCVLGSACLHGLLCLVLVVGPALMTRKVEDSPSVITLINANLTDAASGGGNAGPVAPPPVDPPVTTPVTPPEKPVQPPADPPKQVEEVKPVDPPAPKPVEKAKVEEIHKAADGDMKLTPLPKKKVEPTTTPVQDSLKRPLVPAKKVEPKVVKTAPKVDLTKTVKRDTKAIEDAMAKADAEREGQIRKKRADAIGKGASNIKSKTSAPTTVEATGGGDGSGGQASINYRNYVAETYKNEYDDALAKTTGIASGDFAVRVSVTISNSGKVTGSQVITKSGNPALDKLVQRVLDGVRQIRGFPADAQDSERTFILRFELRPESRQG